MNKNITYKKIYSILKELEKIGITESYNKLGEKIQYEGYQGPEKEYNDMKQIYSDEQFNFIKNNYIYLYELEVNGYIKIIGNINITYNKFTIMDGEDISLTILTSFGKTFIENYKNFFRKLEYSYKDNNFLGSIFLGFSGGVISYILIEIIKKLNTIL